MAHNINYNEQTGKHSFFSVKEKAWHGLGQVIKDNPTSAEAIKFAGLDYFVEKRPLWTLDNGYADPIDGNILNHVEIPVTTHYATVRTDTEEALGVVKSNYTVIQNVEAFQCLDTIIGSNENITYETAGALGCGERIFITLKIGGQIRIGKDDIIEKYLFLTSSHNGKQKVIAGFTPIRVVCENTLNAALNGAQNCINVLHTGNKDYNLKQATDLLGLTNMMSEELQSRLNHWSRIRINDAQVKRLVQIALAPSKEVLQNVIHRREEALSARFNNVVESVMDYTLNDHSQQVETAKGTLFGAFNAVTGYYQNVKTYKTQQGKLDTIMGGKGFKHAQNAYNLCNNFALKGESALQLN